MQAYDKVQQVKNKHGSNFVRVLHDIDPVLVNYWWSSLSNQLSNDRSQSTFNEYLSKKEYQKAYEYSLSTVLTQAETDTLFSLLLLNPDDLITTWQNRINPKPPRELTRLSRFSLNH